MSKVKKIFLSLDDLHKLYGISPEAVQRIKSKKQKKRKAKKQALGTTGLQMGGKALKHKMTGTAKYFNRTNDNLLEQAKVESHLKLINDENEKISNPKKSTHPLLEDAPRQHRPLPAEPKTPLRQTIDELAGHMESGRAKGRVNKNGFGVTFPEFRKPRTPKRNIIIEEDEEIKEDINGNKVNPDDPFEAPSQNVESSNMNREEVTPAFLFDGMDYGMDGKNDGSDSFINDDYNVVPPELTPIQIPPPKDEVDDEADNEVDNEAENIDSATPVQTKAPTKKGRPPLSEKKVTSYTLQQLRDLATIKNIPFTQKDTRLTLYNQIFLKE